MTSAEILKIHQIHRDPGGREVRLVADVRFGDVKLQAILILPFPDPSQAAFMCARIVQGVAPEMDPNTTWVKRETMPDGETVVVDSGRLFRARKKEDFQ